MEPVSTSQLFAMTITLAQMIVVKSLMELLLVFLLLFNALDTPPVMDKHVLLQEYAKINLFLAVMEILAQLIAAKSMV
jgi:hypothetical protein